MLQSLHSLESGNLSLFLGLQAIGPERITKTAQTNSWKYMIPRAPLPLLPGQSHDYLSTSAFVFGKNTARTRHQQNGCIELEHIKTQHCKL